MYKRFTFIFLIPSYREDNKTILKYRNMNNVELETIYLIGLSMKKKTTNANGQSNIDCGCLWQQFEKENYFGKIPVKLTDEKY
jgi:hypothetical protein